MSRIEDEKTFRYRGIHRCTPNEKIQSDLRTLGEVLNTDVSASYEGGETYKKSFDEYMREHEFGLALEVVCDYLVAKGSEFVTLPRILLIQELHSSMRIEDDCISELERIRMRGRHVADG